MIPAVIDTDNYNRATRYLEHKRYDKALQFFRRQPESFKEKYLNMGNCYKFTGFPMKAYEYYLKAADPGVPFSDGVTKDYDLAINNIGLMEYAFGNDEAAVRCFEKGLLIAPDNHNIRWHLGLAQLRQVFSNKAVDKETAFVNYDYRFYLPTNKTAIDACYERWDGVSSGESIIVLAEQGLGDKIQWNRYAVLLKRYFKRVVLQIPECLWPLFPGWEVCTDRSTIQPCTHSVPLCSLTRYFDVSSAPHDYLPHVKPFAFDSSKLNIGIVNSGSTGHKNDYNRSCNISYFSNLTRSNSVQLYNLQPDAKPARNIVNLNPRSWLETCSYVEGLDLIISVDTSIVHLAGTLNVTCWMIQPLMDTDFRWGDSSMGTNNVWYPTVKVVRNENNWDAVFGVVKETLSDFSSKP